MQSGTQRGIFIYLLIVDGVHILPVIPQYLAFLFFYFSHSKSLSWYIYYQTIYSILQYLLTRAY